MQIPPNDNAMKHRTKFSRAQLTLYYLMTTGVMRATQGEIFKAGDDAAKYFNDQMPTKSISDLIAIKAKHGFTEEQWREIMQASGSFWWGPTPEMDACNQEIKKYVNQYIITNGCYESPSCLSGSLISQYKRGSINRTDNKPHQYFLHPRTFVTIRTTLLSYK